MTRGAPEPTVAVPCNRGCGSEVRVPLSVAAVFPVATCPDCQRRYEREQRRARGRALPCRAAMSEATLQRLSGAVPANPERYWWNQF